jgi:hypothetical protein
MRRPSYTPFLSLGLALTAAVLAPDAWAGEESGFQLTWQAPEGCPPASAVELEIERLLAGSARERASAGLQVKGTVEHEAQWLVTLDTTSKTASGHRTIQAATCQALANATALIVALIIDPDAVAAHKDETKVVPPTPVPSLPVAAPTTAPPEPAKQGARTTHGLLGFAAAGNLGVLPSADVALSVHLGVARQRWRIEARGAYGLRQVQSEALSDPPGAFGRFSFVAGTLAGCRTFLGPRIEVGPCASAEVGAVRGQGFGATENTSKNTPWVALGAGGLVLVQANRWLYFPIHADAVIPLWRPSYVFGNVETPIFRSWIVGARLTAGVELRF